MRDHGVGVVEQSGLLGERVRVFLGLEVHADALWCVRPERFRGAVIAGEVPRKSLDPELRQQLGRSRYRLQEIPAAPHPDGYTAQ